MASSYTLVALHGYARSGKTTLLNTLTELGYHVYSTSSAIDQITCEILDVEESIKPEFIDALIKKNNDEWIKQITLERLGCSMSARALKIHVAMDLFMPKYGREGLIKRTFEEQPVPVGYDKSITIFETIGGDEAQALFDYYTGPCLRVNLRSEIEEPKSDYRKLDELGLDIFNQFGDKIVFAKHFVDTISNYLEDVADNEYEFIEQ